MPAWFTALFSEIEGLNPIIYWISQGIGILAIVASLASFQAKNRKGILALQMLSSLLFCLKLFFLQAWEGAYLDLVSIFRTMLFAALANTERKWSSSPLWPLGVMTVMVGVGILTWESALSLFALGGALLSTLALWLRNENHTRLISLLVGAAWIVYYIPFGDFAGIISEGITMVSILIALWRFRHLGKQPKDSE